MYIIVQLRLVVLDVIIIVSSLYELAERFEVNEKFELWF